MYEIVEWGRESKTAEICSHGEMRIFSGQLLLSSAFARLVQGYREAPNHLNFYSFLNFRESSIISRYRIILDSPRFSAFESLVQLRLFTSFQPWAVWYKASSQSGVTFCSSSAGLLLRSPLVSTGIEIFPGLYSFPDAHTNPRWHVSRLIAFHIALIPLGKVWIQLFFLQLWVNSRAD